MDRTCSNCCYFRLNPNNKDFVNGRCYRMPPTPLNWDWSEAVFPVVLGVNWCGEWKEINNDPPLPKEDDMSDLDTDDSKDGHGLTEMDVL